MTIKEVLAYLKAHHLILTTAESCTAGKIINLLAKIENSGECLDVGFVVYSKEAKIRLLGVQSETIYQHSLTSEEVATEMVKGAFKRSHSNAVVATTGIAGSEPMNGIAPGTVCFAWGFKDLKELKLFSETQVFDGSRTQVLTAAAEHALIKIPFYHDKLDLLNRNR